MRRRHGITRDGYGLENGKAILMKDPIWMADSSLARVVRVLLLALLLLLMTACGSFQVSLESTGESPTLIPDVVSSSNTPEEPIAQPGRPGQDGIGPFYIGGLFSPGSGDVKTILEVKNGVAAFTQSPVEMEMLWDYSGPSGRIAYASEFYHASREFSRSVSDLWVYDYASNTAEIWLEDDVSQAFWSPYLPEASEPQLLVAAVFDSTTGAYDLVLVEGPGQTQILTHCASEEFGFSPDGKQVVYKAAWYQESVPRPEDCEGVFLINLQDYSLRRVSDTNPVATGGWFRDQPLWAENLDALLFKSYDETSIFNFVSLDGSGWFPVTIAESLGEDLLPVPFYSLWSDPYMTVVGQTEGMFDPWGVWAYRLSPDGAQIEEGFRIDWGEYQHDLVLLGWWQQGESVLLRDITYMSDLNPLGDVIIWSLAERAVVDTISIKPDFPMTLYPADAGTGNAEIDAILQVFLSGSPSLRAAITQTITAGCTNETFVVGPPPCEEGMAEGTPVERFPYRRYREQRYAAPGEITDLMNFEVAGLYAIASYPQAGFTSEYSPNGEYAIILVSAEGEKAIYVFVEGDRVVQIDFWELTASETLHGFNGEFLLPPLQ